MSEDYWEGATWVYHASITNNGSNSGNHDYVIVPGAGNEFQILTGTIFNGDTSSRSVEGRIRDDGQRTLGYVIERDATVAAADQRAFPSTQSLGDGGPAQTSRFIVSGTMEVFLQVRLIAVNQDSQIGLVARIRGGLPTVTLTSPTGATEVVNTNRVY